MSYKPIPESVKARAKVIVDNYYQAANDMGMMDKEGHPLIGYQADGAEEGSYCSISEQGEPRYFIVSVRLDGNYLMQPLSATPMLKVKIEQELARLMHEAMQQQHKEQK